MNKGKKIDNSQEIKNAEGVESEGTNENPIILDAISQNPDDVIKMYEGNVVNSYSNLGVLDEGKIRNNWGECLYKGKLTSMYSDKNIINDLYTSNILKDFPHDKILRIADFGGGDGFVLNTVIEQLKSKGVNAVGANIDQSLDLEKGNAEVQTKYYENKKNMGDNVRKQTIGIGANFVNQKEKINIRPNSLDCVVMRYSLQYSGNELRQKMLKEIFTYLKPGGKVYCLWPGATSDEQAEVINKPRGEFAKITQNMDPEIFLKGKWLPSMQQVEGDSLSAGFKIISIGEIQDFVSMYSVEGITNGSRFKKFTPEQKENFENFMRQLHKEYPKYIENEKIYKNPNMFIILEK